MVAVIAPQNGGRMPLWPGHLIIWRARPARWLVARSARSRPGHLCVVGPSAHRPIRWWLRARSRVQVVVMARPSHPGRWWVEDRASCGLT